MNDRVALVTGASRGIGEATAHVLSEAGARLVLVARSAEKLEKIAQSLPTEAVVVPEDLTDPEAPARIAGKLQTTVGRLDVLINNAGIAESALVRETSAEMLARHLYLNAQAPFLLMQQVLPLLLNSDQAAVVNVASVVAHRGYEGQAAYGASKHALLGWSKVAAKELASEGVRVHVISPGGVATPMITQVRPDIDPDELISPHDVARMVLFVLTTGSSAAIDEIRVRRATSTPWS